MREGFYWLCMLTVNWMLPLHDSQIGHCMCMGDWVCLVQLCGVCLWKYTFRIFVCV